MKIPIFKLFTVMRFIHQKYFYVCLLLMGLAVCTLAFVRLSGAADFACQSGDESCLLRAIEAANANGEANTIALEVGTYTLEAAVPDEDTTMGPTGLPAVTGVVTIQGRGAGVTNIMRSSSDDFRLVYVGATGPDARWVNPERRPEPGGAAGILNNGTLLITSSTLANNLQLEVRGGGAGGLRNMGTAILANSLVTGNVAQFGTSGIENFGMLVLTKTTLADNAHSGPNHRQTPEASS